MNRAIIIASALLFLSANAQAASKIQRDTVQWAAKLQTIQDIIQKKGNDLHQALTLSQQRETPQTTALRTRIYWLRVTQKKLEAARPKT